MSETITLMGLFQASTDTAEAIDEMHRLGIPEADIVVMTGIPYPEQALGRHHEWIRLPYIVLAGALLGLLFGLFLSVITPAFYPLTVGGRSLVAGRCRDHLRLYDDGDHRVYFSGSVVGNGIPQFRVQIL